MNIFRNQNEKMLEETLAGSTSDAVKKWRSLRYLKITLPLL